jgi:beta-phosphoglucomutase-like phosphatase (HAD superfamily)/tRNA(Leu) C34 or U34 (ribose-2'-O)-methylase TrmL
MPVRCVTFDADDVLRDLTAVEPGSPGPSAELAPEVAAVLDELAMRCTLALVADDAQACDRGGLRDRFEIRLGVAQVGRSKADPRLFLMAAAAAGCRPSELVHVGDDPVEDVAAAQAAGCRAIWLNRSGSATPPGLEPDAVVPGVAELPAALDRIDAQERAAAAGIGVGPHPEPWPDDPRLAPALLVAGDRRNVVDRYRYWREDAIVADLDVRRAPVHVAIENWRHDLNIGTVVRNANAFNVAAVHIVGKRRWNRRGAMATDRYLHVHHHPSVAELAQWAAARDLVLVGIDNGPGSVPIESTALPERAVLVLGQEGPGLSDEMADACQMVCEITQHGSTRSINAGVASGIALHVWFGQHWPRSRPVP